MPRIPNSATISLNYDINFKTIFNIYLWNLLHRCMLIVTDALLNFPFNEIGGLCVSKVLTTDQIKQV